MTLEPQIQEKIERWIQPPYDEKTREEIRHLVEAGNEKELYERFYAELQFGTGGLRGIMGAGLNRMNKYTVARATQGLADYLKEHGDNRDDLSVCIAFDSRHGSTEFARDAASVLAGNGIRTFLFPELRPTPELSFAVRHLKASAGIVVTASHNPKEYNGYKVYWSDGAQIVPPHDKGIIECVKRISEIELVKEMDFDAAREKGLVQILGSDVDEAYLQTILRLSVQPDLCVAQGGKMKIVYTPLHGTGITLVPEALERWGFQNVVICEEQSQPDGDFPNAPSPNPEEPEALKAAIRTAEEIDADLVLATDPDADRVGIAARIGEEYRLMSGNQIASLLVEYVLGSLARAGTLPPDARVVSTVVTTDLINRIAEHYGVKTDQTLTGFKWIGEKIRLYEEAGEGTYLVGGEESYGYLIGTHARDKDAVVSACFIAEMTADSLSKGQTLFDRLNSVFRRFGIFQESLLSMKFPGAEGQERIRRIMSFLRENAPDSFGGIAVDRVIDIQRNEIREGGSGKVLEKTGLPKSNVLIFRLADGSRIAARPSGTEPKIKFYFSVCDRENLPISSDEELERRQEALKCRHQALREEFKHEIDEASPQAGE